MPNATRQLLVRNPYTGELDYAITPPAAGELAASCARLREAQAAWAAAGLEHRTEVMLRWADQLDAAYGPLSAADYTDTGGCLISLMAPGIVASNIRSWAAGAPGVLAAAAREGTSSVIAGTEQEAARIGARVNAGTVALQDTFLTLFKTRDVGTNSFGDSGLGGDRTGPGSILRFVRKKALMTQHAPPAPLARPSRPVRPARVPGRP